MKGRRRWPTKGVARSLYVKCWVAMRLSKPQDALKHALAALPYFEMLGDGKGAETTLNTLGLIYSELGELSEAHTHFLSRYRLCMGRGDEGEAEALLNLGYIHDYLGSHADALGYYLKSWALFATCGSLLNQARLLNNVGYSYYRLEEHEAALEHYRKSLVLSEGDANLYALLLDNMALAFEKLGDFDKALSYQQQSLSRREAQEDERGVAYSLDSLGSIRPWDKRVGRRGVSSGVWRLKRRSVTRRARRKRCCSWVTYGLTKSRRSGRCPYCSARSIPRRVLVIKKVSTARIKHCPRRSRVRVS